MIPMHSKASRKVRHAAEDAFKSARASEAAGHAVFGSQVVLDLYECETPRLDDLEWVKSTLVNAAGAAGATVIETVFHKFAPWGISGVVVIAESHLAIHIWPENRYAAIYVFTCGKNVQIDAASAFLTRKFRSRWAVQQRFARGDQALAERQVPRKFDGCEPAAGLGVVSVA